MKAEAKAYEAKIIVNGNIYPKSGNPQAGRIYGSEGISPSIGTCQGGNGMPKIETLEPSFRIRKLTPSECFKLMGFTDKDCKKASDSGISNSQLYKQAGNSIVVQVMEALFRSLGEKYEDFRCQGIKARPDCKLVNEYEKEYENGIQLSFDI